MSFNKIILVGNLGRDPELRYTPQGSAVCNLSVATSEKRRDKSGEMHDITTWFRVTLWEKKAEAAAKYLTKGSSVYVEGRLRVEEWSDRDGKNRHTLEVHGTDMQFLGGSNRSEEYSGGSQSSDTGFADEMPGDRVTPAAPGDDDIPF
ncbi:MAG: single-stranded DNA-binding protein [Pyrinomonadaceae bacterium]